MVDVVVPEPDVVKVDPEAVSVSELAVMVVFIKSISNNDGQINGILKKLSWFIICNYLNKNPDNNKIH